MKSPAEHPHSLEHLFRGACLGHGLARNTGRGDLRQLPDGRTGGAVCSTLAFGISLRGSMVLECWSRAPRVKSGRALQKGVAVALLVGVGHACGPGAGGQSCPLQNWSGVCTFTSLNKVREVELPVPHGVYEALYTPVANQQSPNYTPPAVRIEIKTLSKHEGALQQHVMRHSQIAC